MEDLPRELLKAARELVNEADTYTLLRDNKTPAKTVENARKRMLETARQVNAIAERIEATP